MRVRTVRLSRFVAVVLAASLGPGDAPAAELAETETRLVLIGGGLRPREAIERLVAWAGGSQAQLLVVPWASPEPQGACAEARSDLQATGVEASVECAPAPGLEPNGRVRPLDPASASTFFAQLSRATGVFFTGGDQGRIMDVLANDSLASALRTRYQTGVVFGGTSAGTAIMSTMMITGGGDPTVIDGTKVGVRSGLGLLSGVILDQHFIKRQRQNRLFGLVLRHPGQRGIGIDEGTALLVTHGRYGEVVGSGLVTIVDAESDDRLAVTLRRRGQKINLRRIF